MSGAGALGRYWIRNRGRVQGPFTVDRIHGLLRRGRFSRHFHVSEDKKEWYPAADFPELFPRGTGGSQGKDDEEVFRGGGSPFDDDDDMEPTRPSRGGTKGSRKSRRQEEDDDPDDEDEDDIEDDDEDEDWDDDDDSGVLGGLMDWAEANAKAVGAVFLLVLLGVGWFAFGRESFARDTADLEVLLEIKTRVSAAHAMGTDDATWQKMADQTQADLEPMVDRLTDTASASDHVKQELLFAARDNIPRMFNELPKGETAAEKRVMVGLSLVEQMIKDEVRFSEKSVLTLDPKAAPASQPKMPTQNVGGQADTEATDPSAQPSPQGNAPPQNVPNNGGNGSPPPNMQPGGNQPQSASPQPNNNNSPNVPPNNNGSGVPGRPNPAKF